MRILPTGATGAIGWQLAPRPASEGHELHASARHPERSAASGMPLASAVAASITGEQKELVRPLVASLGGDLLADDAAARELFVIRIHSNNDAVSNALLGSLLVDQAT